MGRVILFSGVGYIDPIAPNNYFDSGMFHICRKIQPDEVHLYFTKAMIESGVLDKCEKGIQLLNEHIGKQIEFIPIKRESLDNADNFDYYYHDFDKCITEIREKMQVGDVLLFNVTSGTAAMNSALVTLQALKYNNVKLYQVENPVNYRPQSNTTIEELWEKSKDNDSKAVDRTKIVNIPTFTKLWIEDTIKSHLKEYNYTAAYSLAKSPSCKFFSENYLKYLEGAVLRNELNINAAKNCFPPKAWNDIFPVLRKKSIKYFEYILSLDIKRKRGELADFIRALSPIIFELLEKVLSEFDFTLKDYIHTKGDGVDVWNNKKIASGDKLYEFLTKISEQQSHSNKEKNKEFSYGFIKSFQLVEILENFVYVSENKKNRHTEIVKLAKKLREVENKVRNPAAHQIEIVDEDLIRQKVGMSAEDICKCLKELFYISDHLKFDKKGWDCYEKMNEWDCYEKMNEWISHKIDNK